MSVHMCTHTHAQCTHTHTPTRTYTHVHTQRKSVLKRVFPPLIRHSLNNQQTLQFSCRFVAMTTICGNDVSPIEIMTRYSGAMRSCEHLYSDCVWVRGRKRSHIIRGYTIRHSFSIAIDVLYVDMNVCMHVSMYECHTYLCI